MGNIYSENYIDAKIDPCGIPQIVCATEEEYLHLIALKRPNTQNVKMPGEYPHKHGFVLSECKQLRKKTIVYQYIGPMQSFLKGQQLNKAVCH